LSWDWNYNDVVTQEDLGCLGNTSGQIVYKWSHCEEDEVTRERARENEEEGGGGGGGEAGHRVVSE
jgi:hypothetical protein